MKQMSSQILWEIYDYTNDKLIGVYDNYDLAEAICDEYIANYCEPVEVLVSPKED